MTDRASGRELFIVDNSVEGWTGLRYLGDWTEFATSFDIATGYFDIGSLLALDGKWQQLDKIRILMGAEMVASTKALLLKAVEERAKSKLDSSLETEKAKNPFLTGTDAILAALKSGQIECRVYDKDKFHAKTYITHARSEVLGSQALVGSSNFTRPGLTDNVELNVQIQSAREVAQLQEWFEEYWRLATEVTEGITTVVERHIREYSPFDVYAKALQEFFRGHELTATEWDETASKMFPHLDRYQQEAYWALMKIARQYDGAFLCDGVGLGKTFVGLMLIERMVMREGKRVVLFAPKAAKEGVWDPHVKKWLPHISGADFSSLRVFSHTDLGRTTEDFPQRFVDIAGQADVVIIDEAHHFRNTGRKGDENIEPSRYYRMYDLIDPEKRPKQLFMLTATPINNRLTDFRHMAELFTRRQEDYFAGTVGVTNLRSHFNQLEKHLQSLVNDDAWGTGEDLATAEEVLAADALFRELVVQRSRSYAKASQLKEKGKAAAFPERKPPQVAEYSVKKTYGRLLDDFEVAFDRDDPLFRLAMYYPLRWYHGPNKDIDALEHGRQKQVVTLIRIQFLKRFESSVVAFESSCLRMLKRLLAFVEIHSETEAEKKRLDRWKKQHDKLLSNTESRQLELWGGVPAQSEEEEEDFVPPELVASIEWLDRSEYDVEDMLAETYLDLDEITKFIRETRQFQPKHDDKLQKLIRLLKSKEMADRKVLIFTEFADTARYLSAQLKAAGIDGVEQVDSATKRNRADVIRAFAPYYNGSSSGDLAAEGREETRVLISTDVLSEGLNLQDATMMVNYDIHWNPVRLMQRIGRVDRRMDPDIEERIKADHPETAASRGTVKYWNFLPPEELQAILTLYTRVTQKVLLISKTLGIEGKKLLSPDDDWDALRDFNAAYEGTRTKVEDLHLEYQALLQADPDLEGRLRQLPHSLFSGREKPAKGTTGVFLCYALPAQDSEAGGEYTLEAGSTRWYLYDIGTASITEDPGEIASSIRSKPTTPRLCTTEEKTLIDIRAAVQKHIKNSYLKRVNAPLGVKPVLRCWMELNEG